MSPGVIVLIVLLIAAVVVVSVLWGVGVFNGASPPSPVVSIWKQEKLYDFSSSGALSSFQGDFSAVGTDENDGNAAYQTTPGGLVSVAGGQLVLKLGKVQSTGCAQAGTDTCIQAVKLVSNFSILPNKLIVLKASQIPFALCLWPAWWLTTVNSWPDGGEIDMIENVNAASNGVQSTLHSGVDCLVSATTANGSTSTSDNCNLNNGYQGCGVIHPNPASAYQGVFAVLWLVEADLSSGSIQFFWWDYDVDTDAPGGPTSTTPVPENWTDNLYGSFLLDSACTPNHFSSMKMVINSEICGSWSGSVYPGGGQTACSAAVKNIDVNDVKTQWNIDSLSIFTTTDVPITPFSPTPPPTTCTTGGQDVCATGTLTSCCSGLASYLIVPKGSQEGSYHCYSSQADCLNSGTVCTQGTPAHC